MPKKKVPITELPDKEAIRRLFPEKVVETAEQVAHEKDAPKTKSGKSHR